MPFYTTVALVRQTLPKSVGSMTTLTNSDVALYINQTDSMINGKLSKLYTVPISGSAMLETIATDLSCARLLRRLFTQEKKNSSSWVDSFAEAVDELDAIANGEISLVNSAGELFAKATSQVWSNNENYTQTMDEGPFDDSFVDHNKLQDISDAKHHG